MGNEIAAGEGVQGEKMKYATMVEWWDEAQEYQFGIWTTGDFTVPYAARASSGVGKWLKYCFVIGREGTKNARGRIFSASLCISTLYARRYGQI